MELSFYTWLTSHLKFSLSSLFPCHIIIPLLVSLVHLVSISFLHPRLAHQFRGLLVVLFLTRSCPPLLLNQLDMILLHVVLIFIPMVCILFLKIFYFIMISSSNIPHQCACVCRGENYYHEWASSLNLLIHPLLGEILSTFISSPLAPSKMISLVWKEKEPVRCIICQNKGSCKVGRLVSKYSAHMQMFQAIHVHY